MTAWREAGESSREAIEGARTWPRLHCDEPNDGDLLVPGLCIEGWAASPAGMRAVTVSLAGQVQGAAKHGAPRPDVAAAHGGSSFSLASGFRYRFETVPSGIPPGTIELVITAEDRVGRRATLHRTLTRERTRQEPEPGLGGPDFVIIGAQRAGTTSLYQELAAHPRIALPARKELHFFSQFYGRGSAWYRAQFPRSRSATMLTGEATPYYLYHPLAPRRLAACCPTAKLIVLLRDPVDRAYSHYHHEVRVGNETLPFEDALAREEARLAGELERLAADDLYQSFNHRCFSYQARGRYAEQIARWLAVVPRERLLVLESEAFFADPASTLHRVTDFLGLPPAAIPNRQADNEESYPPMQPATRRRLARHFQEANHALGELLGMGFSWNARS